MTAIALKFEHKQQQTLTPRLQQAVRLLQLSSLDFAQEVHAALDKNPFLEPDDNDVPGPLQSDAALPADAATDAAASDDTWAPTAGLPRGGLPSSGDVTALDLVAADVSLREYLHRQINVQPLTPRDQLLTATLIESLDEDGYLRTPLEEVGALSGIDPDRSEMLSALRRIQALEPNGVGARDVAECLLLQMPDIEDDAVRTLATRIVTQHIDRLAHRDFSGLAKTLGRSVEDVERACARIRHLDPRPGWRHGSTDVQYVTPDVVVRRVRGAWVATLNTSVIPRVKLNQAYAKLFQEHRDVQHGEMAATLQEARWTVRNVRQRFSTILKVTEAILKRQHHFLEYGPLAMKPLGLKEIAEELGLHESTVSRVTNNKYMATPVGVFELKYFFSRSMPTASGSACSPTAIRGVIKEMIERESPCQPLSDPEIARLLVRQGLNVARRTVTKYRQLLKVEPVERRRKHA
ncbi:RNA polymerase factor sigma-54 [Rhizobacter sp. LjRoot28]|uniref:RNA polymerase factor sigma-54 n=1 Tax=Rhizobacter sp. LjRoot28 TaxID=3342309 RepID=UPI003ECEC1C8